MAKFEGINIEMGVTISEQTVNRCLSLLTMYLEDHPDMTIVVDKASDYRTKEVNTYVYLAYAKEGEEKHGT